MIRVHNGGIELATDVMGEPVRGTIVLAMGATASMVWWPTSLVETLAAAGYQVIRFDHRDTGQSTTHAPGDVQYGVHHLAGDVMAILDAYGVHAAHLVGMSLGGYISQIAALDHPTRVLSLTLIAAEPVGLAYAGEGIAPAILDHFGKMAELDWSDHHAVVEFLLRVAELSAGSAYPFDRVAAINRIELELQRTGSMRSAFNHAMIAAELEPDLTACSLKMPVMVIHGSEDPIISIAAAHKTQQAIPGSELLVLDGRGHELLEQDVPEIARAILRACSRAG
ncbi:acetyltransferase [Mesorhizobium huakuii]|uniref:alpha/beta fold hydrolase n=1 Tax=Mesorhizobium huakuii TaxID=28104 RepID=UPI00235D391B|nr:alpha/beta hydrolase [Mesorhizobium huakuii]GLQ78892.1 acetyltransferase [Mesorhizobium huakuii]